ECHDRLLEHKQAVFDHLVARWRNLFNVTFDVMLYDLTSTYFESDLPFAEDDKRRFGHSRDRRSDCVQVVIALVVTPEGLPLAYEVLAGNTQDKATLRDFLARIERQQMIDVHIPTTDGRELVLERYTEPERDLKLLLGELKLVLPEQPPPKITASALVPGPAL